MQMQRRQLAADRVQIPDGIDGQVREFNDQGPNQDRDERSGDLRGHFRPQDEDREAEYTDAQRPGIERPEIFRYRFDLFHGLDRHGAGRIRQTEEILQLADEDRDRDARGESDGDGAGDEADQFAEAQNAHDDQQDAGHDSRHHKALQAGIGDDARDDGRERCGRSRDLDFAAAERGDQEAGDDGGVQALFRADAGRQRQRDGERQRDDRYDDARDDVRRQILGGIVFQARPEHGFDGFHGNKKTFSFL